LQYLDPDGIVIAADYPMDMWPDFPFGTEEFIAKRATWPADFLQEAATWRGEDGAKARTFVFGSMPDDVTGSADVVFFPRVLHNLANHDDKGGYLGMALNDAYTALKPGGVLGIVQHRGDPTAPQDPKAGTGYVTQAWILSLAENAGFKIAGSSEINANPRDGHNHPEGVWTLPPTSRLDETPEAPKYRAIGESDRMTVKFVKPPSD